MDNKIIECEPPNSHLSVSEIKVALDSLSDNKVAWKKLVKSANFLSMGFPFSGEDLLHDVLCKALNGDRICKKGLPVEVFIYGAMESLVDAFIKKRKRNPFTQAVQNTNDDENGNEFFQLKSLDTPEAELVARQTIDFFMELFKNDEKSMAILNYQMDGLTPLEIQTHLNLSTVQYASALRAIKRKLEKLEVGKL